MNILPPINLEFIANIFLFLILFALISWILRKSKIFNDSKSISVIISASLAFLAFYGLIRANFSISNLLLKFNFSEAFQYNLFTLISLILIAVLWIKLKTGNMLIVLGSLLALLGMLKIFYVNSLILTIIGLLTLVIGIIIKKRKNFRKKYRSMSLKDQAEYKLKKNL